MRLFVALLLPEDLRERLHGLQKGLSAARWVKPDNLHMTLRFIGEVDNGDAEDLDAALSKIDFDSFELSLDGMGHFGEGRKVRALWVGTAANEALMRLQAKIERAIQTAGFPPEGRKFKPHVTLARFKSSPGPRLADYLEAHGAFRSRTIPVKGFDLMSSFRSQDGSIYRSEAHYPFHPADAPLPALLGE